MLPFSPNVAAVSPSSVSAGQLAVGSLNPLSKPATLISLMSNTTQTVIAEGKLSFSPCCLNPLAYNL